MWKVEHGWRWMFAAAAIPAVIFAITISFSKESPRWLMKVGREQQAGEVLAAINGPQIAASEVISIKNSLAEEQGGLRELFAGPFRRALLIGFLFAAFSQTSGITALLSFFLKSSRVPARMHRTLFFSLYWSASLTWR